MNQNTTDTNHHDKGITLLIVEDEEAHAELIRLAFESYPSFSLHFVKTLKQARALLAVYQFDLILADWMLPDGNGLSLVQDSYNGYPPVVVMTSHGSEQLAVEVLKSKALDYFIKSDVFFYDLPHLVNRALDQYHNNISRKQAEEELRNHAALLDSLLSAVPDLLYVRDRNFKILYSNDKNHDIIRIGEGKPADHCYQRYKARTTPCEICPAWKTLTTGEITVQEDYNPVDHKTRELVVSPIKNATGYVDRLVVIARDITERKKWEQEIIESEKRYRDLVESISDVLFSITPEGIITYTSPSIYQQFKKPDEDFIGTSVYAYIPEYEYEKIQQEFQKACNGEKVHFEIDTLVSEGKIGTVRISAKPVYVDGKIQSISGIMSDITDKKQVEILKLKAFQSIEKNIITLATLNDQIRNPLAIIQILAEDTDENTRDDINEQVKIIDSIVDELDKGWIESTKVRSFLKRFQEIG